MIARRAFLVLADAAIAAPALLRPRTLHAQQAALPVIGFLDARSPEAIAERLGGFRRGLKEAGFVEGENVTILFRFAENQIDRLPELAADLVRRKVAVIATAGDYVVSVAKAGTSTVPIVFIVSQDPVALGVVASLARPGGNVTGVNFLTGELVTKQIDLLHMLVPAATRLAVLVNPANRPSTASTTSEAAAAARAIGLELRVLETNTSREIDAAFATIVHEQQDALLVGSDPFLSSRRAHLVTMAARHAVPTIFPNREFTASGGLISYGSNVTDAWRQSGTYVGRILKGTKPADLPVMQASRFKLVINHQTARMLGLTVPPALLATADEVIE